jgi:hypothetical protein
MQPLRASRSENQSVNHSRSCQLSSNASANDTGTYYGNCGHVSENPVR